MAAVLTFGLAFAGAFSPVAAQTDDTDDDTDNTTETQTQTAQSQSLMAMIRNNDQLNDFETLLQERVWPTTWIMTVRLPSLPRLTRLWLTWKRGQPTPTRQ